jgi:FkbM family methyltransferase
MALSLETFIREELEPLRLPTFVETAREQKIAWRAYGFGAWRRGELSFSECVRNLLPGRFKTPALQRKLQALLDHEVDRMFRKAGLYGESPTLFEKPFSAASMQDFKGWLAAVRLINEVVLQDEYRADRIANDAVVIDAGANIGAFTVFAALRAPEGRVYAFEPTKITFDTLERNTKPYSHVIAIHSALGNRVGNAELLIESASGEGNSLAEANLAGSYSGKETVPVTTIDAFVRERHLPRVDFIKIDTEGFEKEILEGAQETLQKFRPALALSAYHKQGDPVRLTSLIQSYVPEYRYELKKSPELNLICDCR